MSDRPITARFRIDLLKYYIFYLIVRFGKVVQITDVVQKDIEVWGQVFQHELMIVRLF